MRLYENWKEALIRLIDSVMIEESIVDVTPSASMEGAGLALSRVTVKFISDMITGSLQLQLLQEKGSARNFNSLYSVLSVYQR